jgi:sugar lactone lactonase YvrE
LTEKDNLIFTQNAGVAILDRTSLRVIQNSKLAITLSSYRFNDGACDPQGRFITGLMDEGHSRNTGKLYRYDAGLNASVILDSVSLPNRLAWASGRQVVFRGLGGPHSLPRSVAAAERKRGCVGHTADVRGFPGHAPTTG